MVITVFFPYRQERECPALANPLKSKINPIPISQLKKSVKKPNPCPQCNPCLNFCPSPKADGHHYSLIYLSRISHGYIHSVFLMD